MSKGKGVIYNDIVFGSAYEVARYIQLQRLQEAGEISHLECHPRFPLVPSIAGFTVIRDLYKTSKELKQLDCEFDFLYTEGNKKVVEDVKADGDLLSGSAKKNWLIEPIFLAKLKMFLWMKDPTEWDFKIPKISKEELKIAKSKITGWLDGKTKTNRTAVSRAKTRNFKRR
jgi:hypothetical protein